MVNDGAFVEEIADALGKTVNSIRGKALSLLRSGDIGAIPRQKVTKGSSKADPLSELICTLRSVHHSIVSLYYAP